MMGMQVVCVEMVVVMWPEQAWACRGVELWSRGYARLLQEGANNVPARGEVARLVERADGGEGLGGERDEHVGEISQEVVDLGRGHGVEMADERYAGCLDTNTIGHKRQSAGSEGGGC